MPSEKKIRREVWVTITGMIVLVLPWVVVELFELPPVWAGLGPAILVAGGMVVFLARLVTSAVRSLIR